MFIYIVLLTSFCQVGKRSLRNAQGSLLAVITIIECIFIWYFGKLWLFGKLVVGEKDGLKWHVPLVVDGLCQNLRVDGTVCDCPIVAHPYIETTGGKNYSNRFIIVPSHFYLSIPLLFNETNTMASIIYLFSDSSSPSSSASRYVVLFVCFLYIVTKPMFILIVLTPFCLVGKRSLHKDLSWLLSRLSSAYSSGISESYGCSESLLGKKRV
jgi:hypothetical protein